MILQSSRCIVTAVIIPAPPKTTLLSGDGWLMGDKNTLEHTHTHTLEHVARVLRHGYYHGVADGLVLIIQKGGSSECLTPLFA